MLKSFSIPFIYILFFLFSKEFFSYDSEKFVIVCIISFILLSYFLFKEILSDTFIAKSNKLKQEYSELILLKLQVEQNLAIIWDTFLNLQQYLLNINLWIKNNIFVFLKKYNYSRNYILHFLIKDQLNLVLKNIFRIYQALNIFLIKYIMIIFFENINNHNVNFFRNLDFYFDKLKFMLMSIHINSVIFNKLGVEKEIVITQVFFPYYITVTNKY